MGHGVAVGIVVTVGRGIHGHGLGAVPVAAGERQAGGAEADVGVALTDGYGDVRRRFAVQYHGVAVAATFGDG